MRECSFLDPMAGCIGLMERRDRYTVHRVGRSFVGDGGSFTYGAPGRTFACATARRGKGVLRRGENAEPRDGGTGSESPSMEGREGRMRWICCYTPPRE